MVRFFITIIAIVLSVPVGLLGGVVLSDIWGWFILPVFPELPAISTLEAWGIMMVLSFLRVKAGDGLMYDKLKKLHPEEIDVGEPLVVLLANVFIYLICWGTFAVIHALFF